MMQQLLQQEQLQLLQLLQLLTRQQLPRLLQLLQQLALLHLLLQQRPESNFLKIGAGRKRTRAHAARSAV
jgi:hypothetical protein